MKFLVLTANTNNKDRLLDPVQTFPNCTYMVITDQWSRTDSSIWINAPILPFSRIDKFGSRRNAKYPKILSSLLFPQFDYVIWHDANHSLASDPNLIIKENLDADLFLFKHPHRSCLFDELDVIKKHPVLENEINLLNQETYYTQCQVPRQLGLYEMTTFIKKVDSMPIKMLDLMWWEQICKFSSRDQLSFMFCLWQMNNTVKIHQLEGFANLYAGGNKYFTEQPGHLR